MADVPVSRQTSIQIQLEATIRSAHALLQAGLISDATSLLAAFSTEVQPNIDRELTEVRSNLDRTWPNTERWCFFGQVRIPQPHHQRQQSDRQIGKVPTHDVSYGMVYYGQPIHGLSNPSEPKAKIKHITSSS